MFLRKSASLVRAAPRTDSVIRSSKVRNKKSRKAKVKVLQQVEVLIITASASMTRYHIQHN